MSTAAPARPPDAPGRRRCRWAALACAVAGLLLLIPLVTLEGPGSWRTAWLFGLPALVGIAGIALAVVGRRIRLVLANLLCGVLSVPLLLVVLTIVLGP